MRPDEEIGAVYRKVLDEQSPPDGQTVSSASIAENVDEDDNDISDAIGDLIRFGELEFINTSGSNMHVRVRLHRQIENQSTHIGFSVRFLFDRR